MISFDDACRRIESLPLRRRIERVSLDEAHGRVLANPVVARRTAPEAAVSAMDGYAVREADVAGGAARLRIVGQYFAGDAPQAQPLPPGACMRIFTGAPAPAGADRVVIQEDVRAEGDTVLIAERPSGGRHIREAGSDFRAGETLLGAGARLTPQAMVAVAAADLGFVDAFARPSVSIVSTGDELAEPGCAAGRAGAIPESVSFGVAGLVRAWGGEVAARLRVRDELASLSSAAEDAIGRADLVVVTGGASVGERDLARAMFEPLGLELVFSKVAMKPGKPVWLGRVGETPILGLPGNPSAAMTAARLLLAPLLAAAGGRSAHAAWSWRMAPLVMPLASCGDRECFHRGRSGSEGVTPPENQDSSSQKSLAAADLLIRRRPGARALTAGDLVETLAF